MTVATYRRLWLLWIVAFLVIELTAVATTPQAAGTLSVTTWDVWFPNWWSMLILVAFLVTLILHFWFKGRRWWASGKAVAAMGLVPAAFIVWRNVDMLKKIWGGLKKAGSFIMRRGPLVSSAIAGAALVFPQAAPILNAIAGIVSANVPSAAANPEAIKAIGEVVGGLLLLIGSIRKSWSLLKPMLAPADLGSVKPPALKG